MPKMGEPSEVLCSLWLGPITAFLVGQSYYLRCWAALKRNRPWPPPAGGVGGYDHYCIGEEVEWRPPLLYANPLGHRVPATPDM